MPEKKKPAAKKKGASRAKAKPAAAKLPPAPTKDVDVPMPSSAELVPQPNGGALLPGGRLGNAGGGRKPDWFREGARSLLESYNLLPRLAAIGAGLIGEIHYVRTEDGGMERIYTATPIKEQNKAIEVLIKLGVGFASTITGANGEPLQVFVAAVSDANGRPLQSGEVARLQPGTASTEEGE
jgi:hypothetical protein